MPEMNLPVHWKTARLGDVTDIFKGGTPKRSVEKYFRGDIPWAIPTDITALDSALYIDDTDTHISEEALGKSAARLLPAGTVLLTSRATIGETAITTIPMATNQGFANFMCKEMLLNVYLAYYLRYVKKRLIDLAHGSTFKEITKGTLLNVEIPLPPLPEQRAIAHVLQAIQEAKAARQRELALERERKAALMDHLFSHGTKGEPRKQTEIGEIPESWEVVELGDYSELITKGSSPKWQGFDYCDEGIYFVRSQNIGLGRLELNEIAYLPKEFNEKEKKSILQKNDLLINIVGASIGRAAVANDIIEGGNVNQAVAIARLKQEIEPFFVMTFLLTLDGQFQLHKQKKDIARANLSLQDIKNLLIPLPSVSEQTETVEILRACDTKIAALEQEAERLDELFHAMLDELMTGKRSAVPLIDSELPN